MAKLSLLWNQDKILSDSLTSAKVYYRKPFVNPPIFIGTVPDVSPKFSVSHEWGKASGGIMDSINNIIKHAMNIFKSLESSLGQVSAGVTGSYAFTKASSVVTNDFNSMFKQYEGSSFDITIPELTIMLLPTDKPNSPNIDIETTPAKKLLNIVNYQVEEGSKISQNDNSATGKLINSISSRSKGIDSKKFIDTEFNKLSNTRLIGSTAYIRNQLFTVAPLNFVRSYDYSYPVNLQGTLSMVVNGVIYKNLLLKDINVECSKTRLIGPSLESDIDYGPSWIKLVMTFVPAIDYTVRDIEDIVLQLATNKMYESLGMR